ncbi:MAG: hypothetical protein KDD36_08815 [Flavobacteriales bacterium]|nr:hypothetical protein [Flavobacteriales bacterium]
MLQKLRAFIVAMLLVLLALAVVHDVTSSSEAQFLTRYSYLIATLPLMALSVLWLLRSKPEMKRK